MRLSTRHHHVIGSQLPSKFTSCPEGRTIGRFLSRPIHDPSFQFRRSFLSGQSQMPEMQTRHAAQKEAFLPQGDVARLAV